MLQYPTLSCIMHDYLAIQGSAIPLECAFSSGCLTATSCCNKLSAQTVESLQLLKSAYRNGHIMAAHQAREHLKVMWDDTDRIEISKGEMEM